MPQENVRLLNSRCVSGRHPDDKVGDSGDVSSGSSRESDSDNVHLLCLSKGPDHIFRVPGCRKANQDIARFAGTFKHPGKDIFKRIIVRNGRKKTGIYRERFAGERWAIVAEASAKLGGQVLGVGSAAAVAAEKDPVPTPERIAAFIADNLKGRQ
jgi:hypothetical protein